ncbi:MAG: hypothetical protein GC159_07695 [Phycisphaera sp.]|nr:hypothetical protein [Phycisphaera sp.]
MNTTATPDITVVNVISTSYSGSTWLNLLLGAHSEAFSVGEMTVIDKHGAPECKFHGVECPLWTQFDKTSGENAFHQIARMTGNRYLVVNNSLDYLDQQDRDGVTSTFVHLVRDGRAILASTLRKRSDAKVFKESRNWARSTRRDLRLLSRYAGRPQTRVLYEKATADTPGELRRVCDAIGMPFEPEMLAVWRNVDHLLGGSIGLLKTVADEQGHDQLHYHQKPGKKRKDWDYYQKQDMNPFSGERWKTELSDSQLRVFALAAGRQNRYYGYPRSTDRP